MARAAESMAYSQTLDDADLRLTPAAEAKFAELLVDAEAGLNLIRIFVSGGGCGGMGYGMTFAETTTDYDRVREGRGYRVAVDTVAINFLRGAEIDFVNNAFVFNKVFQAVGGSGGCSGCAGARGF